ncbi:MAG: PQQ-binding-like beta-propeller repeat protein [Planctomycetia bacterium]|nr:PQQ-binding-like beta-propeller repeat protein [Planctomycetia bacterium]
MSRAGRCIVGVIFTLAALARAHAGGSNSLLDVSSDGTLLATANRDNGTVSIVEIASGKLLREVNVGHKTESATFLGNSHSVAATAYADDLVVIFDANSGNVLKSIPVFDEPYGIVSKRDGSKVYATLEYPGQVVEIDPAAGTILRTIPAGEFVRGIALSADERLLYATEYYTGSVLAIDLADGKVADRWPGLASENLARQIAVHPRRPKAYVPHIRSRVNVNRGEGSVVPFVSVVDLGAGEGRRRKPVPMDSFVSVFVVANPWETAVSPDGTLLCAVFAGTNDMYVCSVVDDDYRELTYRKVITLGNNPRAVRFTPDGGKFFVYNTLDFQVAEYETSSLKLLRKIQVCENPLGDEILRGKILFYSALEPMVGRRWISCASCHPDGDGDGRTWQNPEGLRNTTALFGMAWTHPIHWSADRDEVQDFEHTVRSPLMQGRGLIRGKVNAALEEPNKGLSRDLDALSAYSNAHKFTLSPHAKQGLSDAAKRGKDIFFARETKCAECHAGPYFCDSAPSRPFKLHDVGTGEDDPSEKMGPKYDTPTLLGVYRTPPYLHHGKARTLEDVLTTCNKADRHGKTSHLSREQIADLVEFLKALPYEDPEPAAQAAGLTKIER